MILCVREMFFNMLFLLITSTPEEYKAYSHRQEGRQTRATFGL
jgi:hypothetical protein